MALNWDLRDIESHDAVCFVTDSDGDRVLSPITHTLIWATIGVGIGRITERNASEFFARYRLTERISGPFLIDGEGNSRTVTPQEVYAHIGLTTNVSDETRQQFLKRYVGLDLDNWKRYAEREAEKEVAA